MRKNAFNVISFLVIAGSFTFLFYFADKHWIPKRRTPPTPPPEVTAEEQRLSLAAVAGAAAIGGDEARVISETLARLASEERAQNDKRTAAVAAAALRPPPCNRNRSARVGEADSADALGDSSFYNQCCYRPRRRRAAGDSAALDAADRLGREVKEKDANGNATKSAVPFYLIPGMPLHRNKYLNEEYVPPVLKPGIVSDPAALAEQSYLVFHYATPDDKYPDPKLGEENWSVVLDERDGDIHRVAFETELGAPYFVKIRKTFSLAPKDYHVGFKIEVERLPGGEKGKGNAAQISGPPRAADRGRVVQQHLSSRSGRLARSEGHAAPPI